MGIKKQCFHYGRYNARMSLSRASLAILVTMLFIPLLVHGQGETDLSATIRAAIFSDPRTAAMSEEDIDAMVAALARGAEAQGMTSQDILWRPQAFQAATEEETGALPEPCVGMPVFFCNLNNAFGLDGSDVTMPITLGVVAALLLFVIGSMLHYTFGRHPVVGSFKTGT